MNKNNRIQLNKAVQLLTSLHFKPENIMVTGSIALDMQGVLPKNRKTHDIDFIIKMDQTTWGCLKLIEAMCDPEDEKKTDYVSEIRKNTIFLKTKDGLDINIWRYNHNSDWSDIKDVETGVYVASVEHIINVKKQYGRAKDYRDISEIVKNIL